VTDMTDVTYEFLETLQGILKKTTNHTLRGLLRYENNNHDLMLD